MTHEPGASPDTAPESLRVESLDGLRGVAAVAVLLGHLLLASNGTQDRFFAYPLNGGEAVIVFFALSGFVLALPASRGRPFALSYFPRRFVRLYFPVWGALVFAALVHVLVTRDAIPGESWWLNAHAVPMTVTSAVENSTMVAKAGGAVFNPALWSLHWEVIFSALLPAFLLVAAFTRRSAFFGVGIVLVCFIALRSSGNSYADYHLPSFLRQCAQYLPVFLLGSVMAYQSDRLVALRRRLEAGSARNIAIKAGLLVLCVVFLNADWWLKGKAVNQGVTVALVSAGACLAVILAIVVGPAERALSAPVSQWLGKRSFSLYLVHAPLIVTLAFAVNGDLSPVPFILIGVPLSLLAADLFYRLVEGPSHRLSRAVGASTRASQARVAA